MMEISYVSFIGFVLFALFHPFLFGLTIIINYSLVVLAACCFVPQVAMIVVVATWSGAYGWGQPALAMLLTIAAFFVLAFSGVLIETENVIRPPAFNR